MGRKAVRILAFFVLLGLVTAGCKKKSTSTTTSGGGTVPAVSATSNPASGPISVTFPTGAFSSAVTLTLTTPGSFPAGVFGLSGTGVGVQITPSQNLQPLVNGSLSISYSGVDLSSYNASMLVIARYDTTLGAWVPLASTPDGPNSVVVGVVDHLSTFQIMSTQIPS